MKKAIIAIFALGLLVFSTPDNTAQNVTVAGTSTPTGHPIQPPV